MHLRGIKHLKCHILPSLLHWESNRELLSFLTGACDTTKAVSSQAHFGSTVDLWGGRQGRSAGETQAPQAAAEMVQGRDDVGLGQ